jgi:VRR-NUC domain-containing protein
VRLTDRERLLRTVPERDWTHSVIRMATTAGFLVHHSRPALNQRGRWATWLEGSPGLPDLILVKPPRVLFVELKRQAGGVLSPHQLRWWDALRACPGVEVYLWKPGDADAVWAILSRKAGEGPAPHGRRPAVDGPVPR